MEMLIQEIASIHRKISLNAQDVFNAVSCGVSVGCVGTTRCSVTFHKQSRTHQISGLTSISLCSQVYPPYSHIP